MMKLLLLEKAVVCRLLEGGDPLLAALRLQLASCAVVQREFTGCGFYTTLAVSADAPRVDNVDARFGDVVADISGLSNGAEFLLYVKNGLLDMLEGYSFDETWPESTDIFELKYIRENSRDWGDLPVLPS